MYVGKLGGKYQLLSAEYYQPVSILYLLSH